MRNQKIYGRIGVVVVAAFGAAAACFAAPPSIALSAAPSPATLGQEVTLTAKVKPKTSTGKVTFYDGTTILGVASLSLSGNFAVADIQTSSLSAGTHALTAYFDTLYAPDVSLTVTPVAANAFAPLTGYSAGTYPVSVIAAQLRNQKVDLAVANYGSNNVSVLLAGAPGKFGTATNYPVGTHPHTVAAGDFDGDGNTDLAVANMGGNVSILINAGGATGHFNSAVNYPAGTTPYTIAVADFNQDGKADLAVLNENAGVTILLGKGDGTFPTALPIIPISSAAGIVAGDFDKDGIPDLAVTSSAGATAGVTILKGNGDGTFTSPFASSFGTTPFAIAVGDLNKDGVEDLVVTDYSGFVWVLIGIPGGTFNTPVSYPVGDVPAAVAVADVDGDGNPDLLVANSYDDTISVLLGDGTGIVTFAVNYSTTPGVPCSIAVANFLGDGRTDMAVANFGPPGAVTVFLGDEFVITKTKGDGQSEKINTAFPIQLVATVKNSSSTAVVGAAVTFTAPTSGASVTFSGDGSTAMVNTAAGGKATAPKMTANGTAGSNYPITASVGFRASTTFLESNAP